MSDNELFEYLDAKAEYLKNHKKPLSPYLTKRFAYIGAAVQNSDKGTDDVYKDTNYDSIKKIAEENGKMGMRFQQTNNNYGSTIWYKSFS